MRALVELLEIRQLFSGPFGIGDRVIMLNDGVNVRSSAAGAVVGSQSTGHLGSVVAGPTVRALNGTTYTWYNVNWDTGTDGWSADVYVGPVAPAAPTLVSPGGTTSPGPTITTLAPTLQWNSAASATSYGVYVRDVTTSALVYSNDSVGNVTSVTLPALAAGHAFRWNARASNAAGFGGFSSLLYFQTAAPVTAPQAPASVAATDAAFTDKVRVTWSAPAGAASYEVWRASTNNSASATKISAADVTTTSVDDTSAAAGVVYYYFVKAKNTGGTSGFSVGDAGSRASAPSTTVVLQAESATNSGGAVATKYAGYTGSGYVDFGGSGSYVQFSATRAAAGNAKLVFRFANGSTLNESVTIRINGTDIVRLPIFPTGSWTTWKTVTVTAPLKAGANTIRMTAGGNGGPDVDSLTVSNGAANLKVNHTTFLTKYKAAYGSLTTSQTNGLNQLLSFIESDGTITDVRWAAYMLATVKLECANTWQPIEEYGKGHGHPYGQIDPATGFAYYGRGYVQLTWASNYQKLGAALGVDLYHDPSLALRADIAYKIMSYGMKMGTFTGVGFAWYLNDTLTDYTNARRIINGTNVASTIAGYATKIEAMLTASKTA